MQSIDHTTDHDGKKYFYLTFRIKKVDIRKPEVDSGDELSAWVGLNPT